ncbi:hypothetical protein DU504_16270 [Haloplanus salinus]|jgi:hypothetical protein|uniref:PrgI family protein n=1 Tax=Haloplanus salinus TaxID=1126245 RepID=A0A368N452_9EURY|nr:hypothetical protein [Haloplanus salinus]RCU44321.1 hypothetical protein DU504_16270 [Haloplanus salinus]
MPDPVPVASNLLESKFLGFSVKRLAESLAIPLAPCAVLYTIGFPLLFTFPLFALGISIGGLIFLKTPPGQRPLRYAHAVFQYKTGSNVYVWRHPDPEDGDLGAGVTQDEWITSPPKTTADQSSDPDGVDLAYPSGLERTRPKIDGSTVEDRP